ncbi:hypothetical protein DPMN_139424 [Dreissena polymorpha]|uniref:Uncharacterized protein n=1 Tax=Dreissena polymorpha TaxID=45954 RepID=A0A9D4JI44_DREPO|nr:hypothetical protein DPMN_139424 [Dreissena polymorpha]
MQADSEVTPKSLMTMNADCVGIPIPTEPRERNYIPPTYLPASITKLNLYKKITSVLSDHIIITKTAFKDVWMIYISHIRKASSRDDFYDTGENLQNNGKSLFRWTMYLRYGANNDQSSFSCLSAAIIN